MKMRICGQTKWQRRGARIGALVVAVLMLFSVFQTTAFAEDTIDSEAYEEGVPFSLIFGVPEEETILPLKDGLTLQTPDIPATENGSLMLSGEMELTFTAEAGDYELQLEDTENNKIGEPVQFTVQAAEDSTAEESTVESVSPTTTAEPNVPAPQRIPEVGTRSVGGVEITTLELHEGSPTGPLVADLLAGDEVDMTLDQEYYLVVNVNKEDIADDCWVSIDLPYWMQAINMVGGSAWKTTGAAVDHTAIDEVVSFTPATYNGTGQPGDGSPAVNLGSGKVVYHIKDTTTDAGFAVSFKVARAYHNMTASQRVTTEQLVVACGDMSGDTAGAAVMSDFTIVTKKSAENFHGVLYNPDQHPVILSGESATDIMWFFFSWEDRTLTYRVVNSVEFDISWPEEATVTSIKVYGQEVTQTSTGANSAHCTVTFPQGVYSRTGTESFAVTATIAADAPDGNYDFLVTNLTGTVYGDEQEANSTPISGTFRIVVESDLAVSIAGISRDRYDWYGENGVEQNTLIANADIVVGGAVTLYSTSQTVHAEYADNAIVRAITVPKFTNPGTTITVMAGGMTRTYDLADVAFENTATYAVIRNTNLGLGENDSIEAVTYEVGEIRGSTHSNRQGSSVEEYMDYRLGAWGSMTGGTPVVSDFQVYETGTDPADVGNTTLKETTSTFNPVDNVSVYMHRIHRLDVSSTINTAGESVHVSGTYGISQTLVGANNNAFYGHEPIFYLLLPEGLSYTNFTVDGTAVTGVDVTTLAAEADGITIWQLSSPAGTEAGFYAADGTIKQPVIAFDLLTDKASSAATYELQDILQVGSKDYPVTYLHDGFSYSRTDDYNINGGRALGVWFSKTISVQELKEITIENAMKVTSGGSDLTGWLQYNESDPNNTRAFMKTGMQGEYRVTITNQTGENASSVEVFIPISKEGQDFGDAFHPNGAAEYDLFFADNDIPTGFVTQYLKMDTGVTYTEGQVPDPADYTVVADPADADMVRIYATGGMAADATVDIIFDVTLGTLAATDYGKINIWNVVSEYQAGASTFVPKGSPEAIEIAGGIMRGTVYSDTNANGVMDAGETGLGGVTVTATDTFSTPRTLTTTTAADGTYEFLLVRNQTTEDGFLNSETTVTITVTNPDTGEYIFSPTTTTGNKPSVVTAAANNTTAGKGSIAVIGTTPIVTDAGLVPGNTITYTAGSNGAIGTPASEDILYGESPAAVPVTTPSTGYHFTGWSLNQAVEATSAITVGSTTYDADDSIPAGTLLQAVDLRKIIVIEDVTATANFAIDTYAVTPTAGSNGTISPNTVQTVNYDGSKSFTLTPSAGYEIDTVTVTRGSNAAETVTPTIAANGIGTYNLANVQENTTIHVTFKEKGNVTITYQSESASKGTVSNASESLTPATGTAQGSTATPVIGYSFVNWTNEVGTVVSTNATFTPAKVGDLNVAQTYTAHFALMPYTITYAYAGGTAPAVSNPAGYTVEDTFPIAIANEPTRTGYTFTGWTVDYANTALADITAAAKPYSVPAGTTGNIALTAAWEAVDYTITYAYAGGTAPAASNPASYTVEDLPLSIANEPTRTGYTFTGWTGSNGTTPQLSVNVPQGTTGSLSYTANWEPAYFKVTYDLNGGVGSLPTDSNQYFPGDTVTVLPAANIAMDGYTFLGWANGSALYSGGDTFEISADTVLRAQWKTKTYIIEYLPGAHGTFAPQVTEGLYLGDYTPAPPTITGEDGWIFTGWNGTPSDVVRGNFKYVAQWAPDSSNDTLVPPAGGTQFTVTFVDWNGVVLKTQIVDEGTSATAPVNPTRESYHFLEWDVPFNNVRSNLTVTAQYVIDEDTGTEVDPPDGDFFGSDFPLVGGNNFWALLNLIFSGVGVLLGAVTGVRALTKRRKDEDGDEEDDKKKRPLWIGLSILTGIAGILLFIFTENMRNPIALTDRWTVVNGILLLAGIVGTIFAFKRKDRDERNSL